MEDKKEGRRGRSDGHGWTGWSVFNKSAGALVVISGPGGVQLPFSVVDVCGGVRSDCYR